MFLGFHSALHGLSVEDKLRLAEELCIELMLDAALQPALASVVKRCLDEYRASPVIGICWEELKSRLTGRQTVQ